MILASKIYFEKTNLVSVDKELWVTTEHFLFEVTLHISCYLSQVLPYNSDTVSYGFLALQVTNSTKPCSTTLASQFEV